MWTRLIRCGVTVEMDFPSGLNCGKMKNSSGSKYKKSLIGLKLRSGRQAAHCPRGHETRNHVATCRTVV